MNWLHFYLSKWSLGFILLCTLPTSLIAQDRLPPIARCKPGLVVTLPVNGEVAVKADEFDDGSTDNVTDADDLKFYFNNDPNFTEYVVNCDTFERYGARESFNADFFLNVEDEAGNVSACGVNLTVQDNKEICGPGFATCSGCVKFWKSGSLVEAYRNGDLNNKSSCYQIKLDTTREVFWTKDEDPLNGVGTRDLLIIQRHLLGITEFTDSEQFIAADVNGSNSISANDISSLRKLILGSEPDFSRWGQPSYLIVREQDSLDLSQLSSSLTLNENDTCPEFLDFLAIKLGDVDGDADSINYNEPRSAVKLKLEESSPGLWSVRVGQDLSLSGLEMKMDIPRNGDIEVVSAKLDLTEEYYHKKDHQLKLVWTEPDLSLSIRKEDVLFHIRSAIKPVILNGTLYNHDLYPFVISSDYRNSSRFDLSSNLVQTGSTLSIRAEGAPVISYQLVDIFGRSFHLGSSEEGIHNLSIPGHLPSGLYHLKCSVSDKVYKIVLKP